MKSYKIKKDNARDQINRLISECITAGNYSYYEIVEMYEIIEKLARRFGLRSELKTEGILS